MEQLRHLPETAGDFKAMTIARVDSCFGSQIATRLSRQITSPLQWSSHGFRSEADFLHELNTALQQYEDTMLTEVQGHLAGDTVLLAKLQERQNRNQSTLQSHLNLVPVQGEGQFPLRLPPNNEIAKRKHAALQTVEGA